MWKTTAHLRHQAKSHWGPLAGLLTGLMFVLVQLTTAHVGYSCGRLGQIAVESRLLPPAPAALGMPPAPDRAPAPAMCASLGSPSRRPRSRPAHRPGNARLRWGSTAASAH